MLYNIIHTHACTHVRTHTHTHTHTHIYIYIHIYVYILAKVFIKLWNIQRVDVNRHAGYIVEVRDFMLLPQSVTYPER